MTYRDDGEAWLARRARLERGIHGEGNLARREVQLVGLEALDHARRTEARRELPVLARAPRASPCQEAFEAMTGQGGVRSCARCEREVFDPARMTLGQLRALVGSRPIRRRPDGTMMFGDCPEAARQVRSQRIGFVIASMAVAGLTLALLTMSANIHRIAPIPRVRPRWSDALYAPLVRDMTAAPPRREMVSFSYYAPPEVATVEPMPHRAERPRD